MSPDLAILATLPVRWNTFVTRPEDLSTVMDTFFRNVLSFESKSAPVCTVYSVDMPTIGPLTDSFDLTETILKQIALYSPTRENMNGTEKLARTCDTTRKHL